MAGWASMIQTLRAPAGGYDRRPLDSVLPFRVGAMEPSAELVLHGRGNAPTATAVARVWDEDCWVSEALCNLWVLERAGILHLRFSLAAPGQEGQQEEQGQQAEQPTAGGEGVECQQDGASVARGSRQAAAAALGGRGQEGGDEAAGPSRRAGAKFKGQRKAPIKAAGATKGRQGAAAVTANRSAGSAEGDGAGPSSSKPAPPPQPPQPTHVRVEIELTESVAYSDLWWKGETGGLGEEDQVAKGKRKRSMKAQVGSKWAGAMGRVVAALLAHGRDLRLGPDCDGLLNFCDTSAEEWAAVSAEDAPQRRREFDIDRLLSSVSLPPAAASAAPPAGLSAHPKHYQLQGLRWMLDRERRGDAAGRGHAHLHPAWLQLVTPDGQLLYIHRLKPHLLSTNFYTTPIGGTCGGFLCDEM